jgi:type IV fimbrial biogenesis protein FimT
MLKTLPTIRVGGFTLIELMIGITVMAIVLALGMPNYSVWIQNTRLRNAAESILNGLQLARSEAVRRNTSVQFTLGAGSSWTVGCVTASADCPAAIQSRSTGEGSSTAITVAAADGTPIVFNNFGRMTAPVLGAGVNSTAINVDVDAAVLSAAQSRDLRITINVGGNIRMCDPTVADSTDSRAC